MKKNPILILFFMLLAGCGKSGDAVSTSTPTQPAAVQSVTPAPAVQTPAAPDVPVPNYGFEVVNRYPHDSNAFTQGLLISDGTLYESTGLNGRSSLRKDDLKTGKVVKKVDVPQEFFAEGLTEFKGKLYQLTWQAHKGFIYDRDTFKKTGEFAYDGEGWGLTHDDTSLILSDGTNNIRFLDPTTFKVTRTISVLSKDKPLTELNELEYVKGEIYANIWQTDYLVRIDPKTGNLLGWVNLSGLLPNGAVSNPQDAVLNGIAYDNATEKLYVTGKLWPTLFEIRLKKQ